MTTPAPDRDAKIAALKSALFALSSQVNWAGITPGHTAAIEAIKAQAVAAGQSPSTDLLHYAEGVSAKAGLPLPEVQRALVADLTIKTLSGPNTLDTPMALDAFNRLLNQLQRPSSRYEGEAWLKDTNIASGLSVPCGVVAADAFGRLQWRVVAGSIKRFGRPHLALDYIRWQGWGAWYELHIDVRALGAFSPAGWTAAYHAVADLLRQNPDIRGGFAASWFFDPHLASISPEMGYLVDIPKQGGATFMRNRPLPVDVTWAMARSAARQRAMKEGRYDPTSYTMAWPRKALIAWSDRERQAETLRASTSPTGNMS